MKQHQLILDNIKKLIHATYIAAAARAHDGGIDSARMHELAEQSTERAKRLYDDICNQLETE